MADPRYAEFVRQIRSAPDDQIAPAMTVDSFLRGHCIGRIRHANLRALPTETLRKIAALLPDEVPDGR